MKRNLMPMSYLFMVRCLLVCSGFFVVPDGLALVMIDNQIKEIDFHRDDKARGVLTVRANKKLSLVDLRRKGHQLQLDIFGADLNDDLIHTLDVVDFATVVKTVTTSRTTNGGRFIINMLGNYDYDYTLRGNLLEVIIEQPLSYKPQPTALNNKINYKGKPISLNFQDIPVRNVLQVIADHNDFNLVVADNVSGNVTLRLDDVPWSQALDTILSAKGLDKRLQGSILLIAPKVTLAEDENYEMELKKKQQQLASLRSELIQVNYAKATDLASLLLDSSNGVGMLSERGSLHVDERTNSLIIKDIPESILSIKDIVSALDIPVRQVQIEARIVTINEGNIDELGVRWGILSKNGNMTAGGSIEGNRDSAGLLNDADIDDFLNVNLGATEAGAASIAFQVAKLGNILLDLELSALEAERKAEIISSPRLMTTNKQTAYIEQGTEIPYLEAASSGAVSVDFKKAALSLKVTPQIAPDNKLVLDIELTQDKVGATVTTGVGQAVAIDTQRIGTQVLVNNSETVVLGGIFQHHMNISTRKVPILGDIPVLGALFRHKLSDKGKRELLIFITPKIVE